MQRLNDRSTSDADQVAVPSGLQVLDELTCAFYPSELVVVAAPPSLGKTVVAIAANVARGRPGAGVLRVAGAVASRNL
jgi:replicative DNA helicase